MFPQRCVGKLQGIRPRQADFHWDAFLEMLQFFVPQEAKKLYYKKLRQKMKIITNYPNCSLATPAPHSMSLGPFPCPASPDRRFSPAPRGPNAAS
ncbi:unnamed protein product [Gadus morhua 'NCC']